MAEFEKGNRWKTSFQDSVINVQNTPKVLTSMFYQPIADKLRQVNEIVKQSYDGKTSVDWFCNSNLDTQAREYQREKVADVKFKQGIMKSIIDKILGVDIVIIPMVHVRIKIVNGQVIFELIDGQQRITSITDFIANDFELPKDYIVGDLDLSGKTFKDLESSLGEYKEIADKIKQYEINTAFYEGLTDQDTADLFIYKLNYTNNMNHQEMRNAILGAMTRWIRNTSRISKKDGGNRHELFATLINTDKGTPYLKHFKLKVKDQRMERDQWLADLTYLSLHNYRNGISDQDKVTKFFKDTQTSDGRYKHNFDAEKTITKLLNLGLDICKGTLDPYTSKLSAMNLKMMILYAREKQKVGKLNLDLFITEWFRIADKWTDPKVWAKQDKNGIPIHYEANKKTPMKSFWKNFNGQNANAINTICNIMDEEMVNVGIEIDSRNYTSKQIDEGLIAQGGKDGHTGKPLRREDAVGDHKIPRSAGIANGGVTEPHNLIVTSRYNNSIKSNMDSNTFNKQMKSVA